MMCCALVETATGTSIGTVAINADGGAISSAADRFVRKPIAGMVVRTERVVLDSDCHLFKRIYPVLLRFSVGEYRCPAHG